MMLGQIKIFSIRLLYSLGVFFSFLLNNPLDGIGFYLVLVFSKVFSIDVWIFQTYL
jgi:hypothetical protein